MQKEVIQASLLADFGLEASFAESTVICVERLIGTGEGLEIMFKEPNPYVATVGLRIEPRPAGAGNSFALEVDPGHMPASFYRAVEDGVSETLRQGRYGWQVVDCHVAMIAARHREPMSVAADFRQLTPLVLAAALSAAQTQVCEPINRFHLEAPATALSGLLTLLARAGAVVAETVIAEGVVHATGTLAAAQLQGVQQQLPGLTSGAGCWKPASIIMRPCTARRRPARDRGPIRSTGRNTCSGCGGTSPLPLRASRGYLQWFDRPHTWRSNQVTKRTILREASRVALLFPGATGFVMFIFLYPIDLVDIRIYRSA